MLPLFRGSDEACCAADEANADGESLAPADDAQERTGALEASAEANEARASMSFTQAVTATSSFDRIVIQHSNKQWEVDFASVSPGAPIRQGGAPLSYVAGHWVVRNVPGFEGRLATIRNRKSNVCAQIMGSSPGSPLRQQPCDSQNKAQQFGVQNVGSGFFTLYPSGSNPHLHILEVLAGGFGSEPIVLSSTKIGQPSAPHQHFTFRAL